VVGIGGGERQSRGEGVGVLQRGGRESSWGGGEGRWRGGKTSKVGARGKGRQWEGGGGRVGVAR